MREKVKVNRLNQHFYGAKSASKNLMRDLTFLTFCASILYYQMVGKKAKMSLLEAL